MNRRSVLSVLLVGLGTGLGAAREFLFVNLNYQLDHELRGTPMSYAHSTFQGWVLDWDAGHLNALKWSLSIGFLLANLLLSLAMCRARFGPNGPWRAVIGLFIAFSALAGVLLALSRHAAWLYPPAIQLAHALQYPIPLLVIWALSLRPSPAHGDRYI